VSILIFSVVVNATLYGALLQRETSVSACCEEQSVPLVPRYFRFGLERRIEGQEFQRHCRQYRYSVYHGQLVAGDQANKIRQTMTLFSRAESLKVQNRQNDSDVKINAESHDI